MIDVYSNITPNVDKIFIALEELGLEYTLRPVNVHKNEQFAAEFRALNPNAKIPVIIDQEGPNGKPLTIFESGAILIYLAEKGGSLLSKDLAARSRELQWLMFQMSGIGPYFGQFAHFIRYDKENAYAVTRYTSEVRRLYDVMEERLSKSAYLGGPDYSIADIATLPWFRTFDRMFSPTYPVLSMEWQGHPNLNRWFKEIYSRPAVVRAYTISDQQNPTTKTATDDDRKRMGGQGKHARSLQA